MPVVDVEAIDSDMLIPYEAVLNTDSNTVKGVFMFLDVTAQFNEMRVFFFFAGK